MNPANLTLHDRLSGLLLGGAVGDALGAPIEFMSRSEILRRYGGGGLRNFAPSYGRLGAITDDTQMTLFTLEGLIRASVRYQSRGICHPPRVIDHAYRRWLLTQTQDFDTESGPIQRSGWLIQQQELWSRRAPGSTCMSALAAKDSTFGAAATNDSKGAGGIMRVGPIGLYATNPFELACQVAELTHGHKTSTIASGWFADCVHRIGQGAALPHAIQSAWADCRGQAPELDQSLNAAFVQADTPASAVPSELGDGWIAEEAAAIAAWCVLTTDDPIEALALAVNIDGDSDTTGSLVGQLYGAALGPGWIPQSWLNQLELRSVIDQLASDAVESLALNQGGQNLERFGERYPGW